MPVKHTIVQRVVRFVIVSGKAAKRKYFYATWNVTIRLQVAIFQIYWPVNEFSFCGFWYTVFGKLNGEVSSETILTVYKVPQKTKNGKLDVFRAPLIRETRSHFFTIYATGFRKHGPY